MTSWPDHPAIRLSETILARSCEAGRQVEATPWFNRQGPAHIVSTAYAPPNNDYDRLGLMRCFLFHALRFFEIPRVLMRFNHVA